MSIRKKAYTLEYNTNLDQTFKKETKRMDTSCSIEFQVD